MRVLVFEPDHTGHRFTYIRLLLDALAELPVEVTLGTTPAAARSREFEVQIAPRLGDATIESSFDSRIVGKPGEVARDKLRMYRRLVRSVAPDSILIPTADGLAQAMGAMRCAGARPHPASVHVEACLHRGQHAYKPRTPAARLKQQLSLKLLDLAPLSRVHHVDLLAYEAIRSRGDSLAGQVRLLPDPVEPTPALSKEEAREMLGVPIDGRIVCCPGMVNRRKGVHLLLDAFERAMLRDDDRLLLAGSVDEPISRALDERFGAHLSSGRIIVLDKYLTNEELNAALRAGDVVAAPYARHIGISNMALRAAGAERPVLATDHGWLGVMTTRFNLGWTCDVENPDAFADAIAHALDESQGFRHTDDTRRLIRFHSVSNFTAHFLTGVRHRLGAPADERLLSWPDAVGDVAADLTRS